MDEYGMIANERLANALRSADASLTLERAVRMLPYFATMLMSVLVLIQTTAGTKQVLGTLLLMIPVHENMVAGITLLLCLFQISRITSEQPSTWYDSAIHLYVTSIWAFCAAAAALYHSVPIAGFAAEATVFALSATTFVLRRS